MQMVPGKLDCTRINRRSRSLFVQIVLLVTFLCAALSGLCGQEHSPEYPEVARLGPSSYCNPFFGFRLSLPAGFRYERIHLPVQRFGRHMLLALHLEQLDRSAEFYISSFEDSSEDPAHLAAKVRADEARHADSSVAGPDKISIRGRTFYRLHISGNAKLPGNESSYYFAQRGYVIHFAVQSYERDLVNAVASAINRLEFVEVGPTACSGSASSSERLYYGPGLPSDLVESTIRANPGEEVPSGEYSGRTFQAVALGVHVHLPPRFEPLPIEEAYRVTELVRDPSDDPESSDRRRALFRSCSRVLFAANDMHSEITSQVHPGLAVVAMPQGCVPDLLLPSTAADREAAEEFATVMARTLGVTLATRGRIRSRPGAISTAHLDGTLPYHVDGDRLYRRASLRVSATASGRWLILIYTVAASPAAERDIESHVIFGSPSTQMPASASK